jgi:predicted nucleic acid-binding protein
MIFTDLGTGDSVFVDANVLVYHFQPHPLLGTACSQLLQRIENQDLHGFASTHILAEVAHRLMTVEASIVFGWPFGGIGNRLRTNPAEVSKLKAFRLAIDRVVQSNLQVLVVSAPMLATAAALSQQLGMLINDALTVAILRAHGLTNLASHDGDFDRVPGLTRFAPA